MDELVELWSHIGIEFGRYITKFTISPEQVIVNNDGRERF